MGDMVKLKNVSGLPLSLFAPSGRSDGFFVDVNAEVSVPGKVSDEDDNMIVIDGRAYPKTLWNLVADKKETTKTKGDES